MTQFLKIWVPINGLCFPMVGFCFMFPSVSNKLWSIVNKNVRKILFKIIYYFIKPLKGVTQFLKLWVPTSGLFYPMICFRFTFANANVKFLSLWSKNDKRIQFQIIYKLLNHLKWAISFSKAWVIANLDFSCPWLALASRFPMQT